MKWKIGLVVLVAAGMAFEATQRAVFLLAAALVIGLFVARSGRAS
jgi:hypothetical protein